MHSVQRLISAALLVVFASLVTGCSSINVPSWDPTDLLDFLDTKKRAVGERKPVFPGGVPGVSQGVPSEYVKGTPEHQAATAAADPTQAPPIIEAAPEPAQPQKKRVASKPTRATVAPNQQDEPIADDADTEVPPPASPPPPRKRAAKKPPADQAAQDQDAQSAPTQQSQSTFQRPLPSGSFQR